MPPQKIVNKVIKSKRLSKKPPWTFVKKAIKSSMLYALCSMLYALCSMLYALCSMLYALCSMLYADTGPHMPKPSSKKFLPLYMALLTIFCDGFLDDFYCFVDNFLLQLFR